MERHPPELAGGVTEEESEEELGLLGEGLGEGLGSSNSSYVGGYESMGSGGYDMMSDEWGDGLSNYSHFGSNYNHLEPASKDDRRTRYQYQDVSFSESDTSDSNANAADPALVAGVLNPAVQLAPLQEADQPSDDLDSPYNLPASASYSSAYNLPAGSTYSLMGYSDGFSLEGDEDAGSSGDLPLLSATSSHNTSLPDVHKTEEQKQQEKEGRLQRALERAVALEEEDVYTEVLRAVTQTFGAKRLTDVLQRACMKLDLTELKGVLYAHISRTVPTMQLQSEHLSRYVWNEKFQRSLEIPDVDLRNQRLAALRQDFVSTAEFYGRIILSERFLPIYRKSIKPLRLGGLAGGEKYMIQGILYKFARDVPLGRGMWMYGGNKRDDAAASKASGNELKGLSAVFQAAESLELRVPLMCLVDWGGFRLSAQAFVPVSDETLVYGSRNAGRDIFSGKDNPKIVRLMKELATALRLDAHLVADKRGRLHKMYGPTDIEVHLGYDGRYYVLDCARLMPPQKPPPNRHRAVFYELFRQEFLTWHNEPLSSDGFSRFGAHRWRKHNEKLRVATQRLLATRIPDFAKSITDRDVEHITSLMHSWGINVRFLGEVRFHAKSDVVRKAALHEMIARTLHKMLQEQLRNEMERIRAPQSEPYLRLVSKFFNYASSTPKLWKDTELLKARVLKKFGDKALLDEERKSSYSLAKSVDVPRLLHRVAYLSGIQLRGGQDLFVTNDITMTPRITEMNIASLALAEQYRLQSKSKTGPYKLEMLDQAAAIFAKAAVSNPHRLDHQLRWLRVLVYRARALVDLGHDVGSPELQLAFDKCKMIADDCTERFKDTIPRQLRYLESSYNRIIYRLYLRVVTQASFSLETCLSHWLLAYTKLLQCTGEAMIDVEMGMRVLEKLDRKFTAMRQDLIKVLDYISEAQDREVVNKVIGETVRCNEALATFLLQSLNSKPDRKRLFHLIHSMLTSAQDLYFEREVAWLDSLRKVKVSRLTTAILDDAHVWEILRLCSARVTRLDLSNCSAITDATIRSIYRLRNLQVLRLRRCIHITDEALEMLASMELPFLRSLDLRKCLDITDKGVRALRQMEQLEKLDLSKCLAVRGHWISDDEAWSSLECLSLEGCNGISKAALRAFSDQQFPVLRTLKLGKLQVVSNTSIQVILMSCPQLEELDLQGVTNINDTAFPRNLAAYCPELRRIRLALCDGIGDGCTIELAKLNKLTSLSLRGCEHVAEQSLIALSSCTTLAELDFTGLHFLSADALFPFVRPTLRSLNMRGVVCSSELFISILSTCGQLRRLAVSGVVLEEDVLDSIHSDLRLVHLQLDSCTIPQASMRQLLTQSANSLRCLKLWSGSFGDFTLVDLPRTAEGGKLRELVLRNLPVSAFGLSHVAPILTLRRLVLKDLPKLQTGWVNTVRPVLPNLRRLHMSQIPVCESDWAIIAAEGKNIKWLRLDRTETVNEPSLLHQFPRLHHLFTGVFSSKLENAQTAADLAQLRVFSLPPALASSEAAFATLAKSHSIQRLLCPQVIAPEWFDHLTTGPIRESLRQIWVAGSVNRVLLHLIGLKELAFLNIRESAAKAVLPGINVIFPKLVFRRSSMFRSKSARLQIAQTELGVTSDAIFSNTSESEESPSPGWAFVADANMDLQLELARVLYSAHNYKLILAYRANKPGLAQLRQVVDELPEDSCIMLNMACLFQDDATEAMEELSSKCGGAVEMLVTGYWGPIGSEDIRIESINTDWLKRSMSELPYTVLSLTKLMKPLLQASKQKQVVVLSSSMGSIEENTGRFTSLRVAGAALNQLLRSMSIDAKQWAGCVVGIAPPLSMYGNWKKQPSIAGDSEPLDVAAVKIVRTILNLSRHDNGHWLDVNHKDVPW